MSEVGHYILSVADFSQRKYPASLFAWAPKTRETRLRDLMRNGGFRWVEESKPPARSVLDEFTPPQLSSARKAAAPRDAGNAETSDPKKIITKLHINWGRVSATQIKRVPADAEGDAVLDSRCGRRDLIA